MPMPPYPAYRPSGVPWLGDVPEHWGVVALRWCSVRYAGGTPDRNKDHYWDDGTIPWINSGAVNQKLITEPSALITNEGFAGSSAKWIPAGALVMALAGQGRTKGMVAQLDIQTTCNQSMAAIVPDERVSARYVFWLLDAQYEVIRNLAGGEQRDGLNLEILGDLPVLLPTLHEQRAIASFLDRETERIDELVAKKRQLIERLQEYRTALITRTVTRGLPPDAARAAGLDPSPRLKPSGVEWLGDVPEHWDVKRVSAAARPGSDSFTDGDWVELPYITDSGVRLIQTGNVGIGTYREQGFRYISDSSFDELRCTAIEPGDVLICRLADPVGRACLAPDLGVRMITSVDVCILKPSEQFSAEYLVFLLSSKQYLDHVDSLVRGGTRDRISRSMLGAIKIPSPPATEQRAIAAYLSEQTSQLDLLIRRAEAAVERLQEYRTALITAAVTGKVDVRESPT